MKVLHYECMLNTRSIQFRLILWYSGFVIAVLLLFVFYRYYGLRDQQYADMEKKLLSRTQQIASIMDAHDIAPATIASEIHSAYLPEINNRFIRIFNPDHSILYTSGMPQDKHFNPADIPALEGKVPVSRIVYLPDHYNLFIVASREEVKGVPYVIEVGIPTVDVEQMLDSLLTTLLYGLPV